MTETTSPPINFLDRWSPDGRDRSHIPPLTPLIAGLRAGQLFLNLLILILAAISADRFGSSDMDAYGMTFFTFVWTLFFLSYVYGTAIFAPEFYNVYAHLAAEVLTCIWWLVSWALCAARATDLNYFKGSSRRANLFLDTLKASAGLGALQWLLFIATLTLLVQHVIHTTYPNGFPPRQPKPAVAAGLGPAPAEAPAGPASQEPPVEMDQMAQPQPVAQAHMGGPGRTSPYPEETGMPVPPQPPMK